MLMYACRHPYDSSQDPFAEDPALARWLTPERRALLGSLLARQVCPICLAWQREIAPLDVDEYGALIGVRPDVERALPVRRRILRYVESLIEAQRLRREQALRRAQECSLLVPISDSEFEEAFEEGYRESWLYRMMQVLYGSLLRMDRAAEWLDLENVRPARVFQDLAAEYVRALDLSALEEREQRYFAQLPALVARLAQEEDQ